VRRDEGERARRLVYLTALDADQPVLDQVQPAYALRPSAPVELGDGLKHRHRLPIDGGRPALVEADHH
jgi:hypothetical protein